MSQPSREELQRLFIEADKAGNEEDARFFLSMLDQAQQQQPGRGGIQRQILSGLGNTAANLGAGLVDVGAGVADRVLGAVDWATGDLSLPEQMRERSNQMRESFRGMNEARNERFQQNATGLERGSAVAADIASFAVPAAKVDKAVRGLGWVRRGLAQGGAAFGLDDVMQRGEGAEEKDQARAGVATGAAFLAEGIAPVLARLGRAGVRAFRQQTQGGKVEVGRRLAAEAGYDQIDDAAARRIANAAEEIEAGADPDVVVFEQLSGVRQTRAAKTADPAARRQAFREEELLESVGDDRFVNFRAAQRNDIERLASRQTNDLYSPETAIDDIRSQVVAARDAAKKEADAGWNFAENADLRVSGDVGRNFQRHLNETLGRQRVTSNTAPDAAEAIERVNQLLVRRQKNQGKQILLPNGQPARQVQELADLGFDDLNEARQLLSDELRLATEPRSRRAIGAAKEALERTFDDIGEEVVLSGDVENIARLREAVGGTRAFHQRFSQRFTKDKIGQYVERMANEENLDALSGFLIGSNSLPVQNAAYAAKAVKRALGNDAPALRRLQDAVLYRAFRSQAGDLSGEQAIANNLKKLLRERGELMSELFTTRERSQLELMARGFDSMTSPFRSSGTTERRTAFDAILSRAPFGERLSAIRQALNQRRMANRAIDPMRLQSTAPAIPAAAAASQSQPIRPE